MNVAPRDRRQEMLAVPERENDRHVGFAALIDVLRFERETARCANETQIFGGDDSDRHLGPSLLSEVAPHPHALSQRRAPGLCAPALCAPALCASGLSCSSSRCRCTMKCRICALSTVRCARAFQAE